MKFKYGSFSVVGGRSYQEDRILIDINDEVSGLYIDFDANVNFIRRFFKDGKKPKYVFGIFDGHGGRPRNKERRRNQKMHSRWWLPNEADSPSNACLPALLLDLSS